MKHYEIGVVYRFHADDEAHAAEQFVDATSTEVAEHANVLRVVPRDTVSIGTEFVDEVDAAIGSFEFAGPGNVEDWEPGEDVDYDALAGDVIDAAMRLARAAHNQRIGRRTNERIFDGQEAT